MTDPVESGSELLEGLRDQILSTILNAGVGKVEKFNPDTMRGDVTPLFQVQDSVSGKMVDMAKLINVRFLNIGAGNGFYERPDYTPGDLVWLHFTTYDIKPAFKGDKVSDGALWPKHSAIVIAGVFPDDFSAPPVFSESGRIIGHVDDNVHIRLTDTDIYIKGTLHIDGDMSTTGKIEADGEISAACNVPAEKVNLATHLHGGPNAAPTPNT